MAPEPKKSRKRAAKPAATKSEGASEVTSDTPTDTQESKPAAKRAPKKVIAEVPTESQAPAKVKKATTPVPVPLFQEAPIEVAPKKARPPRAAAAEAEDSPSAGPSESEDQEQRRRRRRGGRGRRRPTGEGSAEDTVNEDGEALDPDSLDGEEDGLNADGTTHRRRRRRRAKGEGVEAGETVEEDGVVTVVKVRPPRESSPTRTDRPSRNNRERDRDRGRSRDRDRDRDRRDDRAPRDFTRRRGTIITEQEFLARRENVDREMLVRQTGDRTQIAVLEDKIMVEHYVNRNSNISYVGNVYLGRVQNVLPSMEAAFVDIGKGRNAVLYAGEVNWDAAGIAEGQTRKIEHVLKTGQSVLVQVTKDPIGQKGARLTSQISLPGRYLVCLLYTSDAADE